MGDFGMSLVVTRRDGLPVGAADRATVQSFVAEFCKAERPCDFHGRPFSFGLEDMNLIDPVASGITIRLTEYELGGDWRQETTRGMALENDLRQVRPFVERFHAIHGELYSVERYMGAW